MGGVSVSSADTGGTMVVSAFDDGEDVSSPKVDETVFLIDSHTTESRSTAS